MNQTQFLNKYVIYCNKNIKQKYLHLLLVAKFNLPVMKCSQSILYTLLDVQCWGGGQRRSEGFWRPGRRLLFGAPSTPQIICNSPKFAKSLKLFTKFGDLKTNNIFSWAIFSSGGASGPNISMFLEDLICFLLNVVIL